MTGSMHVPMRRTAHISLIALTFVAMACGGESAPGTVSKAEAAVAPSSPVITTVSSVRPVSTTVPNAEREVALDVPVGPEAFARPIDAYEAGEYRVAARMYRAQVDSASTDGHGHYMLGLASWKAGDFAGAKAAFDQAIALTPQFAKAYFNQGRVLLDLDRVSEALEVIEQGRAIDPESSEGRRLVARAQAEGGDVDAAIATYRELLVRDESDVWGLNNLGMLLFERGDVAGALGPLARAVQVRPTAPLFLNNLGMALERSGYTAAALRRYSLAVQHDSSYTKAVRNVERLTPVVTDLTIGDEVDVLGLAEAYRQVVRSWGVEVPTP